MGIQRVYNKETKQWEAVTTASGVPINDLSNSFEATDVEGALQEAASWNTKNSNDIDTVNRTLEAHDEKIEYLMINGGGGSGGGAGGSVLPNLTSTLTGDIVVPKGKEIIIPVFFTSPNMGNGTLIVMLNGVQKDSITLKQGSTDVNLGSFTELRNTLKIYVKDRAGLLSNELSWTVINGGIGLTLDFDYLADYTTGYDILMRYYIDTEEKNSELHVTVDGQLTMQSCEVGYNEFYFTGLGPGIHAVEVKAISGNYMSETYTFNLVVINSESLYVSSSFNNGSKIVYGLPISIPYRSSYKDDTPITINLYLNGELQKTLSAKRGSYAWTLNDLDIGTYSYRIEGILNDKTSKVEGSFEIIESDYNPVKIATAGLRYRLDPNGRSNEDSDKEVFTYSNGMGEITTTIVGSNFSSNGWVDNVLRLDGGAYGIIDYSPWENNVTNGSTIEVVFKSTDIGKPNTRVIEYRDKNTNKGLYVGLESAYMGSTSKQNNVSICPGEKTTVSFVVDRKNKFCKVFVNGICTRAFILSDTGAGASAIYESLSFQNGKIYINANNSETGQGVVDIYDIRIYERTLSDDDIVKNVIALETDLAKQEQMYSFMFENNTLPVMRLTGDTTDMSNIYKKTMRIQYSSPNTEKYGQPFDLNYCKVYWQGTSSLDYVRKNYNIELYDENMAEYYYTPYPNGVEDYLFCLKCDYMESSHARNIGIARLVNTYFYNTKNPAQQKDARIRNCVDGFPILLYVNDEFMGVYNFNIDRYSAKSFGYTDPDKCLVYEISANSDVTAGAFFKHNSNDNTLKYYQSSISNKNTFNNDNGLSSQYIKVTPGSKISFNPGSNWTTTSIELLTYSDMDNTRVGAINKNTTVTIGNNINYIRLNIWIDMRTLPSNTININGKDYTLQKVDSSDEINTSRNQSTGSGSNISEHDYYAQDFVCLYPPTKAAGNDDYGKIKKLVEWVDDASDEEFVDNLEEHFNKEYLIKYIIFAYVFCAVDSLGKNLKLASWDGGDVWYLQMYDLDTTISLDNSGFIKFDSDIEVGDPNVYNTTSSRLWTKVLLLLENDIKSTYAEMRQSSLRLENILECIIEEQIDKIPATYYNKDTQTKYLDFGSAFLYALHGSDREHIKVFMEERLLYLDTLWDYDASVTDFGSLRSSTVGNVYMDIETFKTMYLKVRWRNDTTGGATQKLKVKKNTVTRFSFEEKSSDQEIRIYGGKYIKELGDLTNLAPTTINLNSVPNINNIICHSDKLVNTEVSKCTNLINIDLSNCTNLGKGTAAATTLDVTNCSELEYIDIRGTALQGVQTNPLGSSVKEIWFPSTVESVSLSNCAKLKIVGIGINSSCKEMRLINCPNVETFGENTYNNNTNKYLYAPDMFLQNIITLYLDNSWDQESLFFGRLQSLENITVKNNKSLKNIYIGGNKVYSTNVAWTTISTPQALTNEKSLKISVDNQLENITFINNVIDKTKNYIKKYTNYSWYNAGFFNKIDLSGVNTKNISINNNMICYELVLPLVLENLYISPFFGGDTISGVTSLGKYYLYTEGNNTDLNGRYIRGSFIGNISNPNTEKHENLTHDFKDMKLKKLIINKFNTYVNNIMYNNNDYPISLCNLNMDFSNQTFPLPRYYGDIKDCVFDYSNYKGESYRWMFYRIDTSNNIQIKYPDFNYPAENLEPFLCHGMFHYSKLNDIEWKDVQPLLKIIEVRDWYDYHNKNCLPFYNTYLKEQNDVEDEYVDIIDNEYTSAGNGVYRYGYDSNLKYINKYEFIQNIKSDNGKLLTFGAFSDQYEINFPLKINLLKFKGDCTGFFNHYYYNKQEKYNIIDISEAKFIKFIPYYLMTENSITIIGDPNTIYSGYDEIYGTNLKQLKLINYNITGPLKFNHSTMESMELENSVLISTTSCTFKSSKLKVIPKVYLDGNLTDCFRGMENLEDASNITWGKNITYTNYMFYTSGKNNTTGQIKISTNGLDQDEYGTYRLPDNILNMQDIFSTYNSIPFDKFIAQPLVLPANSSGLTSYSSKSDIIIKNSDARYNYIYAYGNVTIHLTNKNTTFMPNVKFMKNGGKLTIINHLDDGYPKAFPSLMNDKNVEELEFIDCDKLPKNNDNTQSYYVDYQQYFQSCSGLKRIKKLPAQLLSFRKGGVYSVFTWYSCPLEELSFVNQFEKTYDIGGAIEPTDEIIENIVNALAELTEAQNIAMPTYYKSKLTAEQKQIIANKGWNLK